MELLKEDASAIIKHKYITEVINSIGSPKYDWKDELFVDVVLSKIRNEDSFITPLHKYSTFDLMMLLENFDG